MTDSELTKVGLKRVDYSGFKVDFFSMDKTNPYEAVKALIENCGKGEIYADNYKIALVERIYCFPLFTLPICASSFP